MSRISEIQHSKIQIPFGDAGAIVAPSAVVFEQVLDPAIASKYNYYGYGYGAFSGHFDERDAPKPDQVSDYLRNLLCQGRWRDALGRMVEWKKDRPDLMARVQPPHVWSILCNIQRDFGKGTSGYAIEIDVSWVRESMLQLAACAADYPELAAQYKHTLRFFHPATKKAMCKMLAGHLQNGRLALSDETLANMMVMGISPDCESFRRWNLMSASAEKGFQGHMVGPRVERESAFARRAETQWFKPGDALPSNVYRLLYPRDESIVHEVYIGKVVKCAELIDRLEQNSANAGWLSKLFKRKNNAAVLTKLRKIVAMAPDADVIWREKHRNGQGGFIRPLDENVYVLPEGARVPAAISEVPNHAVTLMPKPITKAQERRRQETRDFGRRVLAEVHALP